MEEIVGKKKNIINGEVVDLNCKLMHDSLTFLEYCTDKTFPNWRKQFSCH